MSLRVLVVLLLGITCVPAWATEAWEFEIAIPVANENGPIQVLHVVRQLNVGSLEPGFEIRLMNDPALAQGIGNQSPGGVSGVFDVNFATALGFRVAGEGKGDRHWRFVEGRSPHGLTTKVAGRTGYYVVDSLRVTLDVRTLSADTSGTIRF